MSGQSDTDPQGLTFTPTLAQNEFQMSGVCEAMNAVNCAVVPDPSERTIGRMGRFGRCNDGLSAAIAGSFQFLIPPVKIFAMVVGDTRRLVTSLPLISRWYMNDVPPATSGMYAYGRCRASATSLVVTVPVASRYAEVNGISDAAKSIWFW